MNKIQWGVLSTAKIGVEKVVPAMQRSEHCEIVAIASRSVDRAQKAADDLGIPRAYGGYDELLADADVEAVYNPLPNHMHVPWSVKALEAGKHVLCEKPIGLSAAEGRTLVDAGARHPELKLMEAFMYRHHPQWRRAQEIVRAGGVGELRTIQSFFSYYNDDPENIRNRPEYGGGGLMDIGCYNISLSRLIFDQEPDRVLGLVDYDPELKTDRLASGVLDFETGSSTFTCSMQLSPFQRVNIFGTEGRVEIEIPFNAPPNRPCRMHHQRGSEIEEIEIETCNQYTIQGDLFSEAIRNDAPVPTPIEDAVANMRIIEAVVESGRTNAWVQTAH